MRNHNLLLRLAIGFTIAGAAWSADYLTDGVDNARTGWLKGEHILSPANVGNTKLLWKSKLPSTVRSMTNLFPPVIASRVTTGKVSRDIVIVPAASDDLFALDANTGDLLWRKHFDSSGQESGGSWICAGGQTAGPVIGPADAAGKLTIYALSGDGMLHQINVADGEDVKAPQKFMPPNGKPYALNLFNNVIYTTTGQGCGGVANAFYTFDLKTNIVSALSPGGGGMWGRRGVAIAPDGTIYIGTGDGEYDPANGHLGNAIVAAKLGADGLKLTGYYGPSNAAWLYKRDLDINVTPVAFDHKGKHFLLEGSKECRLWLLDRDNFGGEDHRTPLDRTPLICNDEANYQAQGYMGRHGRMAGRQRRSMGCDAVLRASQQDISRAPRIRPPGKRRSGGDSASKSRPGNGSWSRHGCLATSIWRTSPSSPTASFSLSAAARTRGSAMWIVPGMISRLRRTVSPTARTRLYSRSMRKPAKSCGQAAARSLPGTTTAASQ